MQNPFVWYDLATTDVEAAKAFYNKVVGWSFSAQSLDYQMALVDGLGVGGIMEMPAHLKGMPPFWSGYVFTPDVDAACKLVKELGGTVHREPWDIPGTIRMAVIADPGGAVLHTMQPLSKEERTWPAEGAPGTVGWHELHAANLDEAWDFYSGMFGWTKGYAHDMGEKLGVYQLFQISGKDIGGMMRKMEEMPVLLSGSTISWWTGLTRRRTAFAKRVARSPWGRMKCREVSGFFRPSTRRADIFVFCRIRNRREA